MDPGLVLLKIFNVHMNHPGILLNVDSDSVGLGDQILYKSNKLPVDADAADMRNMLAVITEKASTGPGGNTCASKKGRDGGWQWWAEGGLSWVPGWLLRKAGRRKDNLVMHLQHCEWSEW